MLPYNIYKGKWIVFVYCCCLLAKKSKLIESKINYSMTGERLARRDTACRHSRSEFLPKFRFFRLAIIDKRQDRNIFVRHFYCCTWFFAFLFPYSSSSYLSFLLLSYFSLTEREIFYVTSLNDRILFNEIVDEKNRARSWINCCHDFLTRHFGQIIE